MGPARSHQLDDDLSGVLGARWYLDWYQRARPAEPVPLPRSATGSRRRWLY